MSTNIERELVKENNRLRKRIEELENKRNLHSYKYLVSYNYSSETSAGSGVTEISLGKEIDSINDINYLNDYIKNNKKVNQVIVTKFKLI